MNVYVVAMMLLFSCVAVTSARNAPQRLFGKPLGWRGYGYKEKRKEVKINPRYRYVPGYKRIHNWAYNTDHKADTRSSTKAWAFRKGVKAFHIVGNVATHMAKKRLRSATRGVTRGWKLPAVNTGIRRPKGKKRDGFF